MVCGKYECGGVENTRSRFFRVKRKISRAPYFFFSFLDGLKLRKTKGEITGRLGEHKTRHEGLDSLSSLARPPRASHLALAFVALLFA